MLVEGKIVFSAGRPSHYDIWTIDLESKELARLTKSEASCASPKWSPDGKQIVYVSNEDGNPNIWMVNEDGSDNRNITNSDKYHATPSWSRDGKHLLFCAQYDNDGEIEVWSLDAEGNNKAEKLFKSDGLPTHPSWSPTGEQILVAIASDKDSSIWEFDLRTSEWGRLTSPGFEDFAPAYSPGGELISFISTRHPHFLDSSTDYGIWMMGRDGSSLRCLSSEEGHDKHVSWSPDGRHLIYCASRPNSEKERLKVIDLLHDEALTLKFDRGLIKEALLQDDASKGLENQGVMSLLGLMPESLSRMLYDESYFGTERHPDWRF